MTDLCYAQRLRAEADVVRVQAHGELVAGHVEAYDALCAREARLIRASGWAALNPSVGPKLLAEHGVDLREREADTRPSKRLTRPT